MQQDGLALGIPVRLQVVDALACVLAPKWAAAIQSRHLISRLRLRLRLRLLLRLGCGCHDHLDVWFSIVECTPRPMRGQVVRRFSGCAAALKQLQAAPGAGSDKLGDLHPLPPTTKRKIPARILKHSFRSRTFLLRNGFGTGTRATDPYAKTIIFCEDPKSLDTQRRLR